MSSKKTKTQNDTVVEERPGPAAAQPLPEAPGSQAASLLMGVKLPIRVLLGRVEMSLRDVAQLGSGSVVELDCAPEDPVDIIVNDRVIAHGEVVVVGGNYGVRITQIATRPESVGRSNEGTDLLGLSERLK
jgi:flagellar motor switch protein FliN